MVKIKTQNNFHSKDRKEKKMRVVVRSTMPGVFTLTLFRSDLSCSLGTGTRWGRVHWSDPHGSDTEEKVLLNPTPPTSEWLGTYWAAPVSYISTRPRSCRLAA